MSVMDPSPLLSNDNDEFYTIDDAITSIGTGPFQYKLLFLTGLIWAADAMEMMLLSFLIPKLREDWDLQSPYDGMIGFVVFLGMFLGTATFSILSDRIGRRKIVIFCNISCAIFGTLAAFSPNITFLLITRFLVGFTIGGAAVSFVLFAEYSPKHVRGTLLILEQGFWSFGALFSVFMAWLTLTYLNWRWYLIVSALPLWIVSAFFKWVPESSRYLLASGKYNESKAMLRRLAHENNGELPHGRLKSIHLEHYSTKHTNNNTNNIATNTNNETNEPNLSEREDSMHSLSSNNNYPMLERSDSMVSQFETETYSVRRGQIKDVFVPAYRRTSILLLICFFLLVFGYYGISFISERIFEAAERDSSKDSELYVEMTITTASEIPGLIVGAMFLDRIGRKQSMIYCFGIYFVCCFLLLFEDIQSNNIFGIIFVFFGRMAISLAFLICYVYFSEYYPTVIRTTALGFASSLGRVAGMITSFVSQDSSITTGMVLYMVGGFIALVCVVLLEQDTTGMDMATEIDKKGTMTRVELEYVPMVDSDERDGGGGGGGGKDKNNNETDAI